MLKFSAQRIVEELEHRNIEYEIIDDTLGLIRYRKGEDYKLLVSVVSAEASWVGAFASDHKNTAEKLLQDTDLRFPFSYVYHENVNLQNIIDTHPLLVIKPMDGAHGDGVTINIKSINQAKEAISLARAIDSNNRALIQEQVPGFDVRILIVGGKYVAAVMREPATVVGDGISTIRELIHTENATNPGRSENFKSRLSYIDIEAAQRYLGADIDTSRPRPGSAVRVVGAANLGAGGKATDITDGVPTRIRAMAEEVSGSLGLPTCGVDFMTTELNQVNNYRFIEVNKCPGIRPHIFPSIGEPRPVDKYIVDYLVGEK